MKTNKGELPNNASPRDEFQSKFKEELEKNGVVTTTILDQRLVVFKGDIMSETRLVFYETANNLLESAKAYFTKETERHMKALREGFRDDLRGYKNEVLSVREKMNEHENRIISLER